MQVGFSTWCMVELAKEGNFRWEDAIDYAADIGADCLELTHETGYGYDFADPEKELSALRDYAGKRGITLSGFTFPANFAVDDDSQLREEIERVKIQIGRADLLGVKFVRHDVARIGARGLEDFEHFLPAMAKGAREIADYAAQYGITTSSENHGYLVQASERVRRLVKAVNRPNYKTTIDTGNFLVVDEDPLSAVTLNLPYCSFIHLKDHFVKPAGSADPGEGWSKSPAGHYRRSAILGHGDLGIKEILRAVVESGYDGFLSVEYVGLEGYRKGIPICIDNVRRYLREIASEEGHAE